MISCVFSCFVSVRRLPDPRYHSSPFGHHCAISNAAPWRHNSKRDLIMNLNMSSCVVTTPWHMAPPYRDEAVSLTTGYPSISPAVSPFAGSSPYHHHNGYLRDGDVSPSMSSQLSGPEQGHCLTTSESKKSFTNLDTYKCSQEGVPYSSAASQMGYFAGYSTAGSPYAGSTPGEVAMLASPTPPGLHSPVNFSTNSCMYSPWRAAMTSSSESPPHTSPVGDHCSSLSPTNLSMAGHCGMVTSQCTLPSYPGPMGSCGGMAINQAYPGKGES